MTYYIKLDSTSEFIQCPDNVIDRMVILIDDLQLTHTLFFIMTVLIYIAINGVSVLI